MSPEQVRGLPIDKRSDIFAVGIVLYELLTGERLFIGESDFSTLEKVRNVEIMPPSSYNKKIPQELERVVLKALARDPDDRYANAIDLHDDLQSFLYSVGEFFSRKDLAAWMKKTFAMEIEEDNAKLEEFRQVAPPVAAERRGVAPRGGGRRCPRGARVGEPAPAAPPPRSRRKAAGQGTARPSRRRPSTRRWAGTTRSWTPRSSTRKRSSRSPPRTCSSRTTTARSPTSRAPDILEQARPPELLLTPRPIDADAGAERGNQDDAAAAGAAAAAAARRAPADAGGRSAGASGLPTPSAPVRRRRFRRRRRRPPPRRGPGLRRSGMNLPAGRPPAPRAASASRRRSRRAAAAAVPRAGGGAVRHGQLRRHGAQAAGPARRSPGCWRSRSSRSSGWSTGTTAPSSRGGSS